VESATAPRRPLLTIAEGAARLAIDQKTLRRKIAAGDLPALRIGSGRSGALRIDAAELNDWLEARRTRR
jgi:excisionase family DNA binding protein